ncbi:GNAT family N-acetyltransferase [Aquimarina agarivorans]|uniref:GNAT family N-acetyltransferase n=1 Tax=Aquimarina agarivorans TaxID=980584 RepID=UPI000248E814|nr:GNAT family N-acetyltransferase [Aquimarina agarivorans]
MNPKYTLSIHEIVSESDADFYNDLLKKKWGNNVYYSIAHMNYFLTDNQKLIYFLFKKDNDIKVIMPLILRQIEIEQELTSFFDVTSPYGYSGPLFCNSTINEEIINFWLAVDEWYKKNNVISEFIRFSLNENHKYYSGLLIASLINVRGKLCENFEDQWSGFLSKVRNNFRKAAKHSLEFKIYEKEQLTTQVIAIFYDIYTKTMERNKAASLYFFSQAYFENLILSHSTNFTIAIAYYNNIPASVELNIHHNETIYAFLGGTDSDYFSYRPNDFLRVKLIEWAINNKKKYYVLGGGIKNGDGLYKSKKAFFPKDEEVIFYTGRKIIDAKIYNELNFATNENYSKTKDIALTDLFFPYYRINN